MNNWYRLKHATTQKYLAVDQDDQVDLMLLDEGIRNKNTMFCIRPLN